MPSAFPLMISIGAVGLAVTLALNLYAARGGKVRFFSPAWWRSWFAPYCVGLTFLLLGVVLAVGSGGN